MSARKRDTTRDPVKGQWGNLTTWQCPFCAYDSMDKATAEQHIERIHPVVPDYLKTEQADETPAPDDEVSNGTPDAD